MNTTPIFIHIPTDLKTNQNLHGIASYTSKTVNYTLNLDSIELFGRVFMTKELVSELLTCGTMFVESDCGSFYFDNINLSFQNMKVLEDGYLFEVIGITGKN